MQAKLDFYNGKISFREEDKEMFFINYKDYWKSEVVSVENLDFLIVESKDFEMCFCDNPEEYQRLLERIAEKEESIKRWFQEKKDVYDYEHRVLQTLCRSAIMKFNIYSANLANGLNIGVTSDYLEGYYSVYFVDSIEAIKPEVIAKNNLSKNDACLEVDGHAYNANPGKNAHFKIIVEKVKCY